MRPGESIPPHEGGLAFFIGASASRKGNSTNATLPVLHTRVISMTIWSYRTTLPERSSPLLGRPALERRERSYKHASRERLLFERLVIRGGGDLRGPREARSTGVLKRAAQAEAEEISSGRREEGPPLLEEDIPPLLALLAKSSPFRFHGPSSTAGRVDAVDLPLKGALLL